MGIDPSARASRLRHRMPAVHSTCKRPITKTPYSAVHGPRFHALMPVSSSCLRATIDQMSYQPISRAPDFLWSCRSQSKSTAVYCLGPALTAVEVGNNSLQHAQGNSHPSAFNDSTRTASNASVQRYSTKAVQQQNNANLTTSASLPLEAHTLTYIDTSPNSRSSDGARQHVSVSSHSLLFPHASAPEQYQSQPLPTQPALVVFSGGTAFNSVAGHLRGLTTQVTHVLPVSDDGGSTAEIVRVLGGPAVGDIRSRCLRLADSCDAEARAVKALLAHRLPSHDAAAARLEWYSIVEGEHELWAGLSEPYKHVIRAYLLHFHYQILGHASEKFNFSNGSIGNFFFAGARTFFRSLEAAVFLFSRVARIPEGCTVLPAICTEERITLGAELEDGSVIRGQNNISHPPPPGGDVSQVVKGDQQALPSPIKRVYYLSTSSHAYPSIENPNGTAANPATASSSANVEHEVLPKAHHTVLSEIGKCNAVVYGMGSLYTSICPTICLDGMGEAVATRNVHKLLLLNGSHDRETSICRAHDGPMTASDVVMAVCDALNRRHNRQGTTLSYPPAAYVTSLLVPQRGDIQVDFETLQEIGVQYVVEVQSTRDSSGHVIYDAQDLVDKIGGVLQLPLPVPCNDTSSTQ